MRRKVCGGLCLDGNRKWPPGEAGSGSLLDVVPRHCPRLPEVWGGIGKGGFLEQRVPRFSQAVNTLISKACHISTVAPSCVPDPRLDLSTQDPGELHAPRLNRSLLPLPAPQPVSYGRAPGGGWRLGPSGGVWRKCYEMFEFEIYF